MAESSEKNSEAYLLYLKKFFEKWLPVYDFFGVFIGHVYSATVRAVAPMSDKKVLDICTGTGEVAIRCAQAGAQVYGIDITDVMLERAQEKAVENGLAIEFKKMDARNLGFSDASFDCCVISLALHDMPRPVRVEVIREALRVTKDKLVISDYAFPKNKFLARIELWLLIWFETSYLRRFSEEGILPLLEELKIKSIRRKFVLPFFEVFVISKN